MKYKKKITNCLLEADESSFQSEGRKFCRDERIIREKKAICLESFCVVDANIFQRKLIKRKRAVYTSEH